MLNYDIHIEKKTVKGDLCNGEGTACCVLSQKTMKKYPSVTRILQPYTDFSMVPEYILTRATLRGQEVHRIIAAICQGLWIPPIPPDLAGYILSFRTWFDAYVEKVIFSEKELVDPVYGFLGHLDFYGRLKSLDMTLIDWKTPLTLYKQWKVQLSAYRRLLDVKKQVVDVIASLQLDPKGGIPKMVRYENSGEDFNIFLGLLNAHNYFGK